MDQQLSKSAKKNRKRQEKKKNARQGHTDVDDLPMMPQNMIQVLREQLDVAKTKMDHKKSAELREQIWVLSDLIAGVKTDIPDDDLARILGNIPWFAKGETDANSASHNTPADNGSSLTEVERDVKKLKKRLSQVIKLKERLDKGEKLEANQMEKVNSETALRRQLEEAMSAMQI